jgi:hypothetical protein
MNRVPAQEAKSENTGATKAKTKERRGPRQKTAKDPRKQRDDEALAEKGTSGLG